MNNREWLNSLSNKQLLEWLNAEHKDNKGHQSVERWLWGTDIRSIMSDNVPCNNSSGVKGVRWHKQSFKWYAEIKLFQKKIHLGAFDLFEDAVAARKKAEREIFGPIIAAYKVFQKYENGRETRE